ncbi:MAG: Nif3-like dinuclear metal center hexameric protein [Actinomycetota bacterium]|nr:Nif3-like dinuclear metal center hexameric protein [Actinomycetota bacterium]
MILGELSSYLDNLFHKNLAMSWDKSGLQIGNIESEIKRILVTLNVTDAVADEAAGTGSGLIVAHHPLIFNSLDTVLSSEVGEKEILKLAGNGIAVYAAHTNYDAMTGGLNDFMASKLGLTDLKIIDKQHEQWYKFVVFAPVESEEKIREAICSSGGGRWGNYSCCTFNTRGKGTFIPGKGSKPYEGKQGEMSYTDEVRIECMVGERDLSNLIEEVRCAHPYEEMAYDIYKVENRFNEAGIGRYGSLAESRSFDRFAAMVKDNLGIDSFLWMSKEDKGIGKRKIGRVAAACGSANSLTNKLKGLACDAVVVGEIDYHNALKVIEGGSILIAVGHGNSEKLAVDGIYAILKDYFKKNDIKIDVLKSKKGSNSWRYHIG